VKTDEPRLEKDPDRRVQEAIALIFAKFSELATVRQDAAVVPGTRAGSAGPTTAWRHCLETALLCDGLSDFLPTRPMAAPMPTVRPARPQSTTAPLRGKGFGASRVKTGWHCDPARTKAMSRGNDRRRSVR
jgi:hypothetical protein